MKRVVKFGVITFLSFTLLSNVIVKANDKVEGIKVSENIEKMIRENDYDSVKKIEVDKDGKVKLIGEIDKKASVPEPGPGPGPEPGLPPSEAPGNSEFQNGTYVFDRGDSWIRGRDLGFLKSVIIPAGATGELQKVEYSEFISTVTTTTSVGFDSEFIKSAVTTSYGEGVGQGKEITVKHSIAATDTNIFFKAQTVYRKYETVEFKNSKIVNHGTSYEPTSFTTEHLKFKEGTKVNQKELYQKEDKNILGDPGYDYKPVVIPKLDYTESLGQVDPAQTWPRKTEKFYHNQTAGLYFTVTRDGNYSIHDLIRPDPYSNVNVRFSAVDMGMRLFKVDSNNKILSEVGYKAPAVKTASKLTGFIGTPLKVNLVKGEKYLLVVNEEKKAYWDKPISIFGEFDFSITK